MRFLSSAAPPVWPSSARRSYLRERPSRGCVPRQTDYARQADEGEVHASLAQLFVPHVTEEAPSSDVAHLVVEKGPRDLAPRETEAHELARDIAGHD